MQWHINHLFIIYTNFVNLLLTVNWNCQSVRIFWNTIRFYRNICYALFGAECVKMLSHKHLFRTWVSLYLAVSKVLSVLPFNWSSDAANTHVDLYRLWEVAYPTRLPTVVVQWLMFQLFPHVTLWSTNATNPIKSCYMEVGLCRCSWTCYSVSLK